MIAEMKSLSLKHLFAALFGALVAIFGTYLFSFVTGCSGFYPITNLSRSGERWTSRGAERCLNISDSSELLYDYRAFGVVLFALGAIFIYGVYKNAEEASE
jgi:hypothetical protein